VRYRFFLLRNGAQHIAGARDMGEVDLGLDRVFSASRAGEPGRGRFVGMGAEVSADQLRFVLFQRTGVRLLLGNADEWESVENSFALDFQLPGQIIDSNLTHPLSFPSACPAKFAYLTSRTRCAFFLRSLKGPQNFHFCDVAGAMP
jgi:hypothetical protein